METRNIFCLVGGISRDSLNKKLFKAVEEAAPDHINLDTYDLQNLPFYSQDIEMDPPDSVSEFKEKIRSADAILFITPEYNRSVPGVLKNAIDWGSRPYGQNIWDKYPAAIMGASIGMTGTFGAQQHLRLMLSYLNVRVMSQPEFYLNAKGTKSFNEEGQLVNEKTRDFIDKFWVAFDEWIDFAGNRQNSFIGDYKARGQTDSPHAQ